MPGFFRKIRHYAIFFLRSAFCRGHDFTRKQVQDHHKCQKQTRIVAILLLPFQPLPVMYDKPQGLGIHGKLQPVFKAGLFQDVLQVPLDGIGGNA